MAFVKSFVEEQVCEDLGIVGLYLSWDERRKENNETSSPDFLNVSKSFGRHMCENKRWNRILITDANQPLYESLKTFLFFQCKPPDS